MPDFDRWSADHGDETLRLNYPMDTNAVVIDCGAYHGAWSRKIYDRYHCKILAFEPIEAYYMIAVAALAGTGAYVYHAGLGPFNATCTISVAGDASSILVRSEHQEQVRIMTLDEVIHKHALSRIRLMKINIEGAEYNLLDHLVATNAVEQIDDLQVQFHQFVPNAESRRQIIRNILERTHYLTYNYDFVWENWRIRDTVRQAMQQQEQSRQDQALLVQPAYRHIVL